MQVKTVLNRVQKFKSFVYDKVAFAGDDDHPVIEVTVVPRANSRPVCSGCRRRRPGYDRLTERRFEFVPLWGIAVFFLYAMRRVDCPTCGVIVELVPWADGKHQLTTTYAWFLARWAKRMSWKEVAEVFHTSWEKVFSAVSMAVDWGLAHRDLSGITAIGIDEVLWHRGQKYLTVVYQIDEGCKRLLWLGLDRKVSTLQAFFAWLGPDRTRQLRFICSDMWGPYLKVLAQQAKAGLLKAVHLLDRFHVAREHEQGDRQGPRHGSQGAQGQGYRGPQAREVVYPQTPREPHRAAGSQAGRARSLEPEDLPRLSPQGGLPGPVELHQPIVGRQVPRPVVQQDHEITHRADEEDRPVAARAQTPDPQLVQGQRRHFSRCRRGAGAPV
jgi:hypothetical protein